MKRLLVGLMCLAVSGLVFGGNASAVRKRIEASMLVTGNLVVTTDGGVDSYTLDKQDKLPPEVVDLLHKAVPAWRFKPVVVDGIPVAAKSKMNVRVVASKTDDGNYVIKVGSAYFGTDHKPGEQITGKEHKPPQYPQDAAMARVGGTVYLVIHVGADGHVIEAAAEQVNLAVVTNDSQQKVWRNVLASASLAAVRDWTFNPPTSGPRANDKTWAVRQPVVYRIPVRGESKQDEYGQWEAYIPGPKASIPWLGKPQQSADVSGGADAVADGQIVMDGSGLTLQTPIDHS